MTVRKLNAHGHGWPRTSVPQRRNRKQRAHRKTVALAEILITTGILEEVSQLPAKALVLFDIDGTLLRRAGPHHREALEEAVHRATGLRSSTEGVPVQGMLDRDILTQMLRNAGAPSTLIRRKMAEMVTR